MKFSHILSKYAIVRKLRKQKQSASTINRKVNFAIDLALLEHKKKKVPSIIYDRREGIIYELHSDGKLVPIAKKSQKGYCDENVNES